MEYINYKFQIRLIRGDLKKWKSFDEEIKKLVTSKPFEAKNLSIEYQGNIRFVSVDYRSETIQTSAVLAVRDFFHQKVFIQENIFTESSLVKKALMFDQVFNALEKLKKLIRQHKIQWQI